MLFLLKAERFKVIDFPCEGILIHDETLGRAEVPHGHEKEIPEDHADVGKTQQLVTHVVKRFEMKKLFVQLSLDFFIGVRRVLIHHVCSSGWQARWPALR
jgi:hypothetical protein